MSMTEMKSEKKTKIETETENAFSVYEVFVPTTFVILVLYMVTAE